jgi:hypothetical protein
VHARPWRSALAATAAVLALTVPALPASATTSAADGGTTEMTLRVNGCEGCTIRPFSVLQQASGDQPYVNWKGKKVTVRNGVVRFTIPTAYTDGMSLQVTAPWERGDVGYVPMASLSRKSYCWTGTTQPSATVRLIVRKFVTEGFPSGTAVIPNAYLSSLRQPKVVPGHQDLPYCQVPS